VHDIFGQFHRPSDVAPTAGLSPRHAIATLRSFQGSQGSTHYSDAARALVSKPQTAHEFIEHR
jgi:hypothetical protein